VREAGAAAKTSIVKQPQGRAVAACDTGGPPVAYSAAVAFFALPPLFRPPTMTTLGTPLSPSATRV